MADDGLISMADQFKGLPMADLIGGPLTATCDAQVNLALATANFIQQVGFNAPDSTGKIGSVRTVQFKYNRQSQNTVPVASGTAGDPTKPPALPPMETVELDVPLLAIVKIPSLSITTVDITFDMEVKNTVKSASSEDKQGSFSADASVGWGPFSLKVHVQGSVATHQENTRETDQSAKYHVAVHAEDKGMPEGLSRVLDMMMQSIAPTSITAAASSGGGGAAPQGGSDTMQARLNSPVNDGLDHGPAAAAPGTVEVSVPSNQEVKVTKRGA